MAKNTLSELIDGYRRDDFAIRNIGILSKDVETGIVYFDGMSYDRYWEFIEPQLIEVELTDDELRKYRYKPELLSKVLYGTTQLYHFILYCNRIAPHRFNRKKIKLVPATELSELLSEIKSADAKRLKDSKMLLRD